MFDYIELFYNPSRRHGSASDLSPIEAEKIILVTKRMLREMDAYQFSSIAAVHDNVARWHWAYNKIREMNLWSQDKEQENCVNAFMNSVREGKGIQYSRMKFLTSSRLSIHG